MITEFWSPIEEYEKSYLISNFGRVRSLPRRVMRKCGKFLPVVDKILKPHLINSGYHQVSLGKRKFMIHQLVAKAYIINPENKSQVNHINGIKTDNRLENLEWSTPSENINHSIQIGHHPIGEKQTNSKIKASDIIPIFKLRIQGLSAETIGRKYNIDQSLVHKILNRQRWKHVPVILSFLLFFLIDAASFAQHVVLDTTRSYGVHELKVIADTLSKCQEYHKLLKVATEQVANRDFALKESQKETQQALAEGQLKEAIIKDVKAKNTELTLNLKKSQNKLMWTKVGWVSTTLLLVSSTIYFIIH